MNNKAAFHSVWTLVPACIVVARSMDKSDQTQYESQLNAFITMPYSKLAESLLAREGVFHEVFDGELVVTGNDAQRFAEVFHVETRRPMLRGVLNPHEPHSLPVIRSIIPVWSERLPRRGGRSSSASRLPASMAIPPSPITKRLYNRF